MKDPDLCTSTATQCLNTSFLSDLGSFLQTLSHDLKNQLSLLGSIPQELAQGFDIDKESLADAREIYTKACELSRLLHTGGQFFQSYGENSSNDSKINLELFFDLLAQLVLEGLSLGTSLEPVTENDRDTLTPNTLRFLNTQGEFIAEYSFYGDSILAKAKLETLISQSSKSTFLLELNHRRLLQAVLKLSPIQPLKIEIFQRSN